MRSRPCQGVYEGLVCLRDCVTTHYDDHRASSCGFPRLFTRSSLILTYTLYKPSSNHQEEFLDSEVHKLGERVCFWRMGGLDFAFWGQSRVGVVVTWFFLPRSKLAPECRNTTWNASWLIPAHTFNNLPSQIHFFIIYTRLRYTWVPRGRGWEV